MKLFMAIPFEIEHGEFYDSYCQTMFCFVSMHQLFDIQNSLPLEKERECGVDIMSSVSVVVDEPNHPVCVIFACQSTEFVCRWFLGALQFSANEIKMT